jgi:hypothetical protein
MLPSIFAAKSRRSDGSKYMYLPLGAREDAGAEVRDPLRDLPQDPGGVLLVRGESKEWRK